MASSSSTYTVCLQQIFLENKQQQQQPSHTVLKKFYHETRESLLIRLETVLEQDHCDNKFWSKMCHHVD
jgi:hypothetical protein